MMSPGSYDIMFCFRLLISFEISETFASGPIWLRAQILGADSKYEVIFYERPTTFCNIHPDKASHTLFNNKVAMTVYQAPDEQNIHFWMLST